MSAKPCERTTAAGVSVVGLPHHPSLPPAKDEFHGMPHPNGTVGLRLAPRRWAPVLTRGMRARCHPRGMKVTAWLSTASSILVLPLLLTGCGDTGAAAPIERQT